MSEDQVVGYYCRNCKESVKCKVVLRNLKVVTRQSPHEVEVEVDARCPNCEAYLANGVAFIRLY